MVIVKKIVLIIIFILGSAFFVTSLKTKENTPQNTSTATPPPEAIEFAAYSANFEIYTNGTKRIFTDQKYHNKSKDVYIEPPNTGIVRIEKPMITWSSFFETLPMKLTKECLTTGTGQNFCTNEIKKLMFFINGIEEKDALEKIIEPNSTLVVKYD